jgi:signal transduction histidine kinase
VAALSAADLQLASAGAAAAIALFCFGVWLGRRIFPNLLVFLILVLGLGWTWNFPVLLSAPRAGWTEWLQLACAAGQLATAHWYWAFLHGQRSQWIGPGLTTLTSRLRATGFWKNSSLDRAMPVAMLAVLLAALPLAPWTVAPKTVLAGLGIFAAMAGAVETRNVVRGHNGHAYLFSAAYWLTLALALAGGPVAFAPFAFAFATGASLARNLVSSRTEAERLNASLERQLHDREAELARSYEKLREAERLQTLGEERRRLTQDMHDGLGSSLVSALRVVESGRMSPGELEEVLKSCIDDLKLTIDSMEPVEADLLLLLATLRFRLGPRLAAAGIALRWEVSDVPKLEWLDPRNSLHILRILQEAFANILKHTRATEIHVTTQAAAGSVSVTIADNGGGFDPASARAGKGLANQRRRAEAIGGRIALDSSAGGTQFTLHLPEKRAQEALG